MSDYLSSTAEAASAARQVQCRVAITIAQGGICTEFKQQFDAFGHEPRDVQVDVEFGCEEGVQRSKTVAVVLIHINAYIHSIRESMLQAFEKANVCQVITQLIVGVKGECCQSMKHILSRAVLVVWLMLRTVDDVEDAGGGLIMGSDREVADIRQGRWRLRSSLGHWTEGKRHIASNELSLKL